MPERSGTQISLCIFDLQEWDSGCLDEEEDESSMRVLADPVAAACTCEVDIPLHTAILGSLPTLSKLFHEM